MGDWCCSSLPGHLSLVPKHRHPHCLFPSAQGGQPCWTAARIPVRAVSTCPDSGFIQVFSCAKHTRDRHLVLSGLTYVPEVRGKQKWFGNCSVFVSLTVASVTVYRDQPCAKLWSEQGLFCHPHLPLVPSYILSISSHPPHPLVPVPPGALSSGWMGATTAAVALLHPRAVLCELLLSWGESGIKCLLYIHPHQLCILIP